MQKAIQLNNITIFIILLFPIILLSSLNNVESLSSIGILAIFLILGISVMLLFRNILITSSVNKYIFKILIPTALLTIVMLIGTLTLPTTNSLLNLGKFFGSMCILMFFSLINWNSFRITIAYRLSLCLLIILPIIGELRFTGPQYVFVLFFVLISNTNKSFKFILSIICVYLIYLSEARALLVLLATMCFTYVFWKTISKSLIRFKLYFFSIAAILLSFIFIYPKAVYWQSFEKLNNLSLLYTGQRLNSGRETLWETIVSYIMQRPLLGYGTGASPANVTGLSLSSHNLYIQISFQNGLIGLALFFIILYAIWKIYYVSKDNQLTRLSASFFIGIIIYSSFEVILIQNKMDTATMFWLIISIGVSSTIYRNKLKEA